MKLEKDKYGIDCFRIKVNKVSELNKKCGVEPKEYLASEYGDSFYLLRSGGVFGCIVLKGDCELL